MPPDRVKLRKPAQLDLDAIGRPTADWVFGELAGLRGSDERAFRPLFGRAEKNPIRRLEIGDYTATFSVEHEGGQRVFWVERVVLRRDLKRWLDDEGEQADEWDEPN
jgi:hypothetical protein